MKEEIKRQMYSRIADQQGWFPSGRAKIRIGQHIVHVRFCSTNPSSPQKYKFNINPNTLTADYELWICGSEQSYYLVPIDIIKEIYSDPDSYQDYHHEGIKVVYVDNNNDFVTYATGGKSLSLKPFFKTKLK